MNRNTEKMVDQAAEKYITLIEDAFVQALRTNKDLRRVRFQIGDSRFCDVAGEALRRHSKAAIEELDLSELNIGPVVIRDLVRGVIGNVVRDLAA